MNNPYVYRSYQIDFELFIIIARQIILSVVNLIMHLSVVSIRLWYVSTLSKRRLSSPPNEMVNRITLINLTPLRTYLQYNNTRITHHQIPKL